MNPPHDHPPENAILTSMSSSDGFLGGKFLLATPNLHDTCFRQAVILMCQHDPHGAMGIILNKPLPNMRVRELVRQFNLETDTETGAEPIYFGGPIETVRGFVLHTDEYVSHETQSILPHINLTATLDVVQHIARNTGPRKRLMALGYAGWSAGQLEDELRQNSWIVAEGNETILFDTPTDSRWELAYKSVGLDPNRFTDATGSA